VVLVGVCVLSGSGTPKSSPIQIGAVSYRIAPTKIRNQFAVCPEIAIIYEKEQPFVLSHLCQVARRIMHESLSYVSLLVLWYLNYIELDTKDRSWYGNGVSALAVMHFCSTVQGFCIILHLLWFEMRHFLPPFSVQFGRFFQHQF
jgi:hypothetical protein